jgi:dihydrolipoamide dehydrogenase
MAKKRKVEVVQGTAALTSRSSMEVTNGQGEPKRIDFKHTILAIGSRPVAPPNMSFDHPRVMDSTDTLDIQEAPERLLIVGAGVNGLEAAMVYRELGSKITMVELTEGVLPGTDRDLAKVLEKQAKKEYEALYLSTKVTEMKPDDDGVTVRMEGEDAPKEARFDRVAIMVGRRPNGDLADLEKAGVEVDDKGFIPVDSQMRTNVENIFAIGDVAGHPMFAHKATYEGKLAAEVAAGSDRVWDTRGIPAVVYTDPELAWVGLTETEAKKEEIDYESATFPWQANGRTIASNRSSGLTKLLFDPKTRRVLGAGIVGPIAGDLISACALAIEMGADAEDIGLTIHPHPTYSETVRMAAERYEGTITDL